MYVVGRIDFFFMPVGVSGASHPRHLGPNPGLALCDISYRYRCNLSANIKRHPLPAEALASDSIRVNLPPFPPLGVLGQCGE